MISRFLNRIFICTRQGHLAGTMKDEHYGGHSSEHCLRCGGYIYEWRA